MENDISSENFAEALKMEEEARTLFRERRVEEAFQAYREAAFLYRHQNQFKKASVCFSQAALCEKIRTGLEPVREAALMSDLAAQEALKAKEYADAKWLFREAGLLYEKEGEFEDYSRTFIRAQETHMLFLRDIFVRGKKQNRFHKPEEKASWLERSEAFAAWILGGMSRLIWRYGEDPIRPILVGVGIIFFCAVIYQISGPVRIQLIQRSISFSEALYMSSVTFTTVGFGDYVPLGMARFLSILEAFSGIFLMPLFVIALTRRYLRVYR